MVNPKSIDPGSNHPPRNREDGSPTDDWGGLRNPVWGELVIKDAAFHQSVVGPDRRTSRIEGRIYPPSHPCKRHQTAGLSASRFAGT